MRGTSDFQDWTYNLNIRTTDWDVWTVHKGFADKTLRLLRSKPDLGRGIYIYGTGWKGTFFIILDMRDWRNWNFGKDAKCIVLLEVQLEVGMWLTIADITQSR